MTYEQYEKAESLIDSIRYNKKRIEKLESVDRFVMATIDCKDKDGHDITYLIKDADVIREMMEIEIRNCKERLAFLSLELEKI